SEWGSKIDRRTISYLTSVVGADLRRLNSELKKLSAAAMPEGVITIELIDDLVSRSNEIPNFDLTDHLVAGRKQQALAAMKKILDDGAEPLALLGLVAYNFRRLLVVKDMMDAGAERAAVARAAGLRYSDQEVFFAAARRTEAAKLMRVVERLAQTDLAIKTSLAGGGKQGSRLQIEMLVCELASA
nr:DNA polymerase III subunit delta [Blastocatellia bacterium]